ncbi:MAG TPA: DbpA RNA binding domain-containing protein, partial [Luteimonas sp.]|nr:DbpA RNA binding domain-containing protein [Luteimonas sp.]
VHAEPSTGAPVAPAAHAGGTPDLPPAASFDADPTPPPRAAPSPAPADTELAMETFRIEVGHVHGVQPGNIVGAIANEADLESRYIGRIDIRDDYSLVDLPEGMPRELLEHLKRVYVSGQALKMRRADAADVAGGARPGRKPGGPRPHGDRPQGDRPRPPGSPRPGGPRSARPPFPPRTPHRKGPPRGNG